MTERASHRKLPIDLKAQRDGLTLFGSLIGLKQFEVTK